MVVCPEAAKKLRGERRQVSLDFLTDSDSRASLLLIGKRPAWSAESWGSSFVVTNVAKYDPFAGLKAQRLGGAKEEETDVEAAYNRVSDSLADIDAHLPGGINILGYAYVGRTHVEEETELEDVLSEQVCVCACVFV